jgi:lysophospholipase L1-like esterase
MKNFFKIFSFVLALCLTSSLLLFTSCKKSKINSIDFSKTSYLAFGDSITHGNYLEKSYPKLVFESLKCKSFLNKGVGGSTYVHKDGRNCIADDVLYYLNRLEHYDIISVAGGVNDHDLSFPLGLITDSSTTTIYGSLNIIANRLKTCENTFVFFITPIKYDRDRVNFSNYQLSDVAQAVIDIGKKYDIPVLDLFSISQFETAESGMNNINCDGTHPLQEYMNDYMSPLITQFIIDNYKK